MRTAGACLLTLGCHVDRRALADRERPHRVDRPLVLPDAADAEVAELADHVLSCSGNQYVLRLQVPESTKQPVLDRHRASVRVLTHLCITPRAWRKPTAALICLASATIAVRLFIPRCAGDRSSSFMRSHSHNSVTMHSR